MTLNDCDAPFYWTRCVKVYEDRTILSGQKDRARSLDFSDVKVVHTVRRDHL